MFGTNNSGNRDVLQVDKDVLGKILERSMHLQVSLDLTNKERQYVLAMLALKTVLHEYGLPVSFEVDSNLKGVKL